MSPADNHSAGDHATGDHDTDDHRTGDHAADVSPADDDLLEPESEQLATSAATPGEALLAGQSITLTVGVADAGQRLDWFLASKLPQFSRTLLRKAINAKLVEVDARRVKAAHRLAPGEQITLSLSTLPSEGPRPEAIPLELLYEDEAIAVINKPSGMVVHPGKGHWSGTLTAALQFHFAQLSGLGGPTRPGIVHRLDRDTSGVIVVAKNDLAHQRLSDQFAERTVRKEYLALTWGIPPLERDQIDLPIGPHPYSREKMAVRRGEGSRPAQSFYEVVERFAGYALVKVTPKTGRTHQIRVHLASVGSPVLCDRLYGARATLTLADLANPAGQQSPADSPLLERQALHASRLVVRHPLSDEPLEFVAPLAADIAATLAALRQYRAP